MHPQPRRSCSLIAYGHQPSCFAHLLASVNANLVPLTKANSESPNSDVQVMSYSPLELAGLVKTPVLRVTLSTPSVIDNEAHCNYNAQQHFVTGAGRSGMKGGEGR